MRIIIFAFIYALLAQYTYTNDTPNVLLCTAEFVFQCKAGFLLDRNSRVRLAPFGEPGNLDRTEPFGRSDHFYYAQPLQNKCYFLRSFIVGGAKYVVRKLGWSAGSWMAIPRSGSVLGAQARPLSIKTCVIDGPGVVGQSSKS